MIGRLAAIAFAAATVGCASDPYSGINFEPQPARLETSLPGAGAEANQRVRALATIVGIRSSDAEAGRQVDVRLRVENDTESAVTLDPRHLTLIDAKLQPFGEPMIVAPQPDGPIVIAPDSSAVIDASFPFPPDVQPRRVDLDSLTLRWQLGAQDQRATAFSTTFRRDRSDDYYRYSYYDPFWGPRFSYHDRFWWPDHRHW